MAIAKPSYDQFEVNVIKELGFDSFAHAKQTYEFNLRNATNAITPGAMTGIVSALKDISAQYAGGSTLLFFPSDIGQELRLLMKPFSSVIDKLYRKNVIFNKKFPDISHQNAIVPHQMYEKIDDLVRGRIVCKYMDGPQFVCKELKKYCESVGIESMYRELSTDAGYYAWHFYFRVPVELALNGIVEVKMWVEIQMPTQLAEVLTALTHGLYETRRHGNADKSWKWDAASRAFRSAYLGHGLHLLEGIIQNLKDDLLNQSFAPKSITEAKPTDNLEET